MQNLINHHAIQIDQIAIYFNHKDCITQPFSATINYGDKIAIIGRNGCGKSSLLKVIAKIANPQSGTIIIPEEVSSAYIPQLILNHDETSGGERFNKILTEKLIYSPNLILLDEPTNHLDHNNRQSLINMIKHFPGTIIMVTHDLELMDIADSFWHINHGKVNTFYGKYSDYIEQQQQKSAQLKAKVKGLNQEKKDIHEKLMREQSRAKTSKSQGKKHIEERKWPSIVSNAKASRGQTTSGKKTKHISQQKDSIIDQLDELYIPEIIIPKFNLSYSTNNSHKLLVNIENGSCGYDKKYPILNHINLKINSSEKIILTGNNGSGKSTLIKAILNNKNIHKDGIWELPHNTGYLDQHYTNLDNDLSAITSLVNLVPQWNNADIRNHLNSFLLRKNEEVNLPIKYLSGGEKVRLSLALIAANTPQLLILDEPTNNLDLETKNHLLQILNEYPAAFILICHEKQFIENLKFDHYYFIEHNALHYMI